MYHNLEFHNGSEIDLPIMSDFEVEISSEGDFGSVAAFDGVTKL